MSLSTQNNKPPEPALDLKTINNAQAIPCFPDFVPLDINIKNALHPRLSLTNDGVSEFTFAGLYLFRKRYNYRISRLKDDRGFIISGKQPEDHQAAQNNEKTNDDGEKSFFMTPCAAPDWDTLASLFKTHNYWKNISETVLDPVKDKLQENGITVEEDRNNFDYLYNRTDLAELAGKKFHKKKNHVNNFKNTYTNYKQRPLTSALIPDAIKVLDRWRQDANARNAETGSKGSDADFIAAKEALDLFDSLALKGSIFYIDEKPAAWCLGESIARGRMFAIHFEKAIDEYKGIYQFLNQAFAESLPRFFTLINREQDLGSEGLRQAKMTYRPCGFVKKYTGRLSV